MSERIEQAVEEAYGEAHEIKDEAKKIIQLSDIGFAEACESVLGGRESVSLPAADGKRCEIGPLSNMLAERMSYSNPMIDEVVESVYEKRAGVDEISKSQGKAGLPEHRILEKTDWEALAGIVREWIGEHEDILVDLGIESTENVSPLKAALLASKIVNSSLRYDYVAGGYLDMLSKEEQAQFSDRDEFEATAESRRMALDSSGVDTILTGGKGLCGHYAIAAEAVFEVIKKTQKGPGLDGSALISIPAIAALDVEKHCYNILLIGVEEGGVKSGALDPLWADPREDALTGWMNSLDKFYTRMSSLVYFLAMHNVIDPYDKSTLATIEDWINSKPNRDYKFFNSIVCKALMEFPAEGSDKLNQLLKREQVEEPELRVAIALYGLNRMLATAKQVQSDERLSDRYHQYLTEVRQDREQLVGMLDGPDGVSKLNFNVLSREHLSKLVVLQSFRELADPGEEGRERLEYEFDWGDGLPSVRVSVAGYLGLKSYFSPGEKSRKFQERFKSLESVFLHNILYLVEKVGDELNLLIEGSRRGKIIENMSVLVGDDKLQDALETNLRSLLNIVSQFDNQELKSKIENEIHNLQLLNARRTWSEK